MAIFKPQFGTQLNWGHPLADGLKACYLFNEGSGNLCDDLSGNKYPGTLSGATLPAWAESEYGKALDFSAANTSYVDCGYPIIGSELTGLTVEAILKPAAAEAQLIIENGTNHETNTFYIAQENSTKLSFLVYGGAVQQRLSATTYAAGTFYHVVGTWSNTQDIPDFYLNGVLDNGTYTGNIQATLGDGNTSLQLGRRPNTINNDYTGQMVLARFWDRTLSAEEINSLYHYPYQMFTAPSTKKYFFNKISGDGFPAVHFKPQLGVQLNRSHPLTNGLVGAWLFNERSGGVAFDPVQRINASVEGGAVYNSDGIDFSAGTGAQVITPGINAGPYIPPAAWTAFIIYKHSNGAATNQGFFGWDDSGTWPVVLLQLSANDRPLMYMLNANYVYFDAIPNSFDGALHSISFTLPGAGQTDVESATCYFDGNPVGIYSTVTTGGQAARRQLRIGRGPSTAYDFEDTIACFYLYDRVLEDAALRALHYDPYQMFTHPSIMDYISVGGAPPAIAPTSTLYGPLYGPMAGPI